MRVRTLGTLAGIRTADSTEIEHAIYSADAILDYPHSGEIPGPQSFTKRGAHPANRHFAVLRIVGGGDLWVSECVTRTKGCQLL